MLINKIEYSANRHMYNMYFGYSHHSCEEVKKIKIQNIIRKPKLPEEELSSKIKNKRLAEKTRVFSKCFGSHRIPTYIKNKLLLLMFVNTELLLVVSASDILQSIEYCFSW